MGTVRFRRINLRLLAVLAIIAIMATAAYGFAATNKFDSSKGGYAGDGSGKVSGFTISNVQWTLNGTDPSTLDAVTFQTDNAATTVKASLDDTTWYSCGQVGDATHWSCGLSDHPSVQPVDNLRVVAVY